MSEQETPLYEKVPRNDVQFGKFVILETLSDLEDSQDGVFKTILSSIFHKPLLTFPEAHEKFIASVADSADLFDSWINLQVQIYTDLGAHRQEVIRKTRELSREIIAGTPGGDSYVDYTGDHSRSFEILLMIRMFGKDTKFNNLFKEAGGSKE